MEEKNFGVTIVKGTEFEYIRVTELQPNGAPSVVKHFASVNDFIDYVKGF